MIKITNKTHYALRFLIHVAEIYPTGHLSIAEVASKENISEKFLDYANEVKQKLAQNLFRVDMDNRNETLNKKLVDARFERIPYLIIIGEKEVTQNVVAVKNRDTQKQVVLDLATFIDLAKIENIQRSLILSIG